MAKKKARTRTDEALAAKCKTTLDQYWKESSRKRESENGGDYLTDQVISAAIRDSLDDATDKSYHYVLITQLLAKVTNERLNARSLQEGAGIAGSFDPRSPCKKVVVPFDRTVLDGALGRSPDPYVNNPLRVPLLAKTGRASKSDPMMWDKLCDVVDAVEKARDREFTGSAFRQVLLEIHRKLGHVRFEYDIPLRISLAQTLTTTMRFISEQSGGDRPLAVAAALFQVVGQHFGLFDSKVRRGKVTASDEASGQVADIECPDSQGKIVMAVEVKDRTVKISDLEEKLAGTRAKGVKEVFFVSAKQPKQADDVPARVAKEFSAGQNLYVFNLIELAESVLAVAARGIEARFPAPYRRATRCLLGHKASAGLEESPTGVLARLKA